MKYFFTLLSICLFIPSFIFTNEGISIDSQKKYKKDFNHFDYVNPNAPKKGILRLSSSVSFDSLNPFILKGRTPQHIFLTIGTLFEQSEDEPFSAYPYIASSLKISPDKKSVTFFIHPNAQFSNDSPITAEDVVFSFHMLKNYGYPKYQEMYSSVIGAKKHNDHQVSFQLARENDMKTIFLLSQLPIFSKKHYMCHEFQNTSLTPPPSSGAYKIKKFEPGKQIAFERIKNWWAQNLPTQKGRHNFDYIEETVYRDDNTAFEAFKSHEIDYRIEMNIQNWVRKYNFCAAQKKQVHQTILPSKFPKPVNGIILNTRNPHLKKQNVRKALNLLFDFDWLNKNMFYGLMTRIQTYFPLSPFDSQSLAIQKKTKTPDQNNRTNTQKAIQLFLSEGYLFKNQKIIDEQTHKPLEFTIIIHTQRAEKIALFFKEELQKKLGIHLKVILLQNQQYQQRIHDFDFDMAFDQQYTVFTPSLHPGNELSAYFSSIHAKQKGSFNYSGIKNQTIDEVIKTIAATQNKKELINHMHTLDKILLDGSYKILGWYFDGFFCAYWHNIQGVEYKPAFPKEHITHLWHR